MKKHIQSYRATELQSYRATGKLYLPVICLWLLALIISPQVMMGQINPNQIKQSYSFIENKGQWDSDVLFLGKSNSLRVWITKKSMVFEQFEVAYTNENVRNSMQDKEIKAYAIALEFQNSMNADVQKTGEGKTKFNYFIGNDKSKHKTGVMQYEEVMLKGIYDGIDMRYYFDGGEVRYDYIVQPYADPTQIELEIKGAQENKLENGELVMKTSLKPVVKQGLYAYQKNSASSKQTVNSSFVLTGNKLKLNIGEYDKSKVLVIDPLTLVGTPKELISNDDNEYFQDLTIDASGDIYFTGKALASFSHTTFGAHSGSFDAVVGKLYADFTSFAWITFFGGTEEDHPSAIEVDANYVYLTGSTRSDETSFPVPNAHTNFDEAHGPHPIPNSFFSVFDLSNGSLRYSSYLNAAGSWNRQDIKVSSQGNVYLTGTFSNTYSTDFIQTCSNATQTCVPIPNTEIAYIMKFTPSGSSYSLAFSTTIVGDGPTDIAALDIDEDNFIYITGSTASTASCIGITSGAYNEDKVPNSDMIYAAKLQYTNCINILYNTYINIGSMPAVQGPLQSSCLTVHDDIMYIGGAVEDDIIPLKNQFDGDFDHHTNSNHYKEAFISVIAPNAQGDADLLYSSYFGGEGTSMINSLSFIEECNSLVFTGYTASELDDYQGDIVEEFSGTTNIMVGVVNIDLALKNTLIDLAYLDGNNGVSVDFYAPDNKVIVGGDKLNQTLDMAIYKLDKRPCTISQGCECGILDQPENWITLGNEEDPLNPEDTVCLINLGLEIPPGYLGCFSHFQLNVNNQISGQVINTEKISITRFESILIPYTLRFGEETIVTLTLYRHENDNSPCVINKIYRCPCDCPDEMEDWFTMTIGPMPDSCETDCYVQHNLNIPDYYSCFKYYYYSNPQQGIEAGEEPFSLDDVEDQISQFNGCIGYGETSGAIVTLLRYPGDTEPCILEYSVHCDSNIVIPDWIPPPCDTTCAIPYDLDTLSYTSTICPNCEILVWYRTRVNCEGEQELEVFKITYLLRGCDKCNEDVIFREAVYRIIKRNKMVFEPVSVGCDTTWRVGMGSCWAWTSELYFTIAIEVIRDPVTGIIISIDIRLIPHERWIHKKCDDTDCCSILIEVCRDLNNDVTITPISDPDEWQECDPHMIFDIWGRGYLCAPKCDWLIGWYPYLIEPKDDNSKNHLNHSINQHNNYVSSIQEGNVLKITEATIIIYDLIGRQVLSRQITINNNETESVLQIKDLNNGVYRYVIMIDGKVIKSDKILITK